MLIVQKFGGTSVATPDLIRTCALHVKRAYDAGHHVIVVVSAMAGVTDQLAAYVREVALAPDMREYDVVVSSGEQVTCGLMALTLKAMGLPAASWLSWQIPVRTCDTFGQSRVLDVASQNLEQTLTKGMIPVVAGFQGVTRDNALTTFGRGGSDITAVALAASLKADRCELYKDVPGILTADPRIVPNARLIPRMTGQEMLELASLGAKVLQPRAMEMALNWGVNLKILSTFEPSDGTFIELQETSMENPHVRALVCQKAQAQLVCPHENKMSALMKSLERAHIPTDMVSLMQDSLAFCVPQDKADQTKSLMREVIAVPVALTKGLAKISLVGVGLRGHPQILRTVLDLLDEKKIALCGSCVSETRLSILIDETYAELAVRLLHQVFGLEENDHGRHLKSA